MLKLSLIFCIILCLATCQEDYLSNQTIPNVSLITNQSQLTQQLNPLPQNISSETQANHSSLINQSNPSSTILNTQQQTTNFTQSTQNPSQAFIQTPQITNSSNTLNSTSNTTTQKQSNQTIVKDDDYVYLPVVLDDYADSAQNSKNLTPNNSLSSGQQILITQPHVPYKGQQQFQYPDDVISNNATLNQSQQQPTNQQQPQNVFEQSNKTEPKIQEFKPQNIQEINSKNQTQNTTLIEQTKNTTQIVIVKQNATLSNSSLKQPEQKQTKPSNQTQQTTNQTQTTLPSNSTNQTQPNQQNTKPEPSNNTSTNHTSTQQPGKFNTSQQNQQVFQLKQQLTKFQQNNNLLLGQRNQLQNDLLLAQKQNTLLKADIQQVKTQLTQLQSQYQEKIKLLQAKYHKEANQAKRLTEENLILTHENNKNIQNLPHTQIPNFELNFEQQKVILQSQQKQLDSINQALNSLKVQAQTTHQTPETAVNPIPSQQITSLTTKVTQLQTTLQKLSTQSQEQHQQTSQQQSTLNEILQLIKNIQYVPLVNNQQQVTPTNSEPQNVRSVNQPTGIHKQQTGYRVDVIVDWITVYIVAGIAGLLVFVMFIVKICSRCKRSKKPLASDQRQLKTPQSMDSRTSEEQFSDWQG